MSEALIFASTNPQYDDILFIELQVQYMKIPSSNLGRTCCVQKLFLTFRTIFVHNMFSPCSAKRRAFDKDLPVHCIQSYDTAGSLFSMYCCCMVLQNSKKVLIKWQAIRLREWNCIEELCTVPCMRLNWVFLTASF